MRRFVISLTPLAMLLSACSVTVDTDDFDDDRFEPNDTVSTAALIDLPFEGRDLSVQSNDTDYYEFDLAATSEVYIEASFEHDFGDIDIALLDADGSSITSSFGTSDVETIQRTLDAGTYIVEVDLFGFDNTNDYDLVIEN